MSPEQKPGPPGTLELERLKALLSCAGDALTYETQRIRAQGHLERKEAQAGIARLKPLLTRAADALEAIDALSFHTLDIDKSILIAELRKAVE